MSKTKKITSLLGSLFLIAALIAGTNLVFQRQSIIQKAAPATTLSISTTSQNINPGDSFPLAVKMDTGENHSIGFDASINFNPDIFEITAINSGDADAGFTVVKSQADNGTGNVLYSVFNLDTAKAMNGSGLVVLNLTARVKNGASPGTYSFNFDSSSAVAALEEKQNVLMSTYPASIIVHSVVNPTTTPTAGEPNSCGGTCGSNINCQSNYFCYQGYCRNPSCPGDSSCGCVNPTATPKPATQTTRYTTTTAKTAVPKATATPAPTPEIVYYFGNSGPGSTATPKPTQNSLPTLVPVATPENPKTGLDGKYVAIIAAGILIFITAIVVLFKSLGGKKGPPKIYTENIDSSPKNEPPFPQVP